MSVAGAALSLAGIVAVIGALLVLIRGQMKWTRVITRRVAMIALVISTGVFFVGIGLSAASSNGAVSVPTPPAATTH